MITNQDHYKCSVCKEIYKNPAVHRPCGKSFHYKCLGNQCPEPTCDQTIKDEDLSFSNALLKPANEPRISESLPPVYYLILLDTSTSMWYSDTWLPFAYGKSRFDLAKEFLRRFFQSKLNSQDKVSLVTFDVSPLERFNFETISEEHLKKLDELKCDGAKTALTEAIRFGVDKCERYTKRFYNRIETFSIILVTDGGENVKDVDAWAAMKRMLASNKFTTNQHFIHIGNNKCVSNMKLSNILNFIYHNLKDGNVTDIVNALNRFIFEKLKLSSKQIELLSAMTTSLKNRLLTEFQSAMTISLNSRLLTKPQSAMTTSPICQLPAIPNSPVIFSQLEAE